MSLSQKATKLDSIASVPRDTHRLMSMSGITEQLDIKGGNFPPCYVHYKYRPRGWRGSIGSKGLGLHVVTQFNPQH